jgi:hypothetical protein
VDQTDTTRPDTITKKGGSLIKRNSIVFAFFLLLSFIFWYLNSLGKTLETDIKYPVKYTNIPKNRELKEPLPSRLELYITGPGYTILRLKLTGRTDPLTLDFSKVGYLHRRDIQSGVYYVVTSGLIADFNTQLKSSCRITSIKPDTLFFSLKQASK